MSIVPSTSSRASRIALSRAATIPTFFFSGAARSFASASESIAARAPGPSSGGMPLVSRAVSHHSSSEVSPRGTAPTAAPKTLAARRSSLASAASCRPAPS